MINCGVCGKDFGTNEEYKDHVVQAHEAVNSIYEEAFCKGNEGGLEELIGNVYTNFATKGEWKIIGVKDKIITLSDKDGTEFNTSPGLMANFGYKGRNFSKMSKDTETVEANEVDQSTVNDYLRELRDSGVTNMFGAGSYLQEEFGLDSNTARKMLSEWMRTFKEEDDESYRTNEVYWKDIGDKKVIDKGTHYELDDGGTIDWSSYDAKDAQAFLSKKAKEGYDSDGNYTEKCKTCGKVFDNPADAGSHPHDEAEEWGHWWHKKKKVEPEEEKEDANEENPNHADDGKFSSGGGSSGLSDSHKKTLDKYIEKHGKEDFNAIYSLAGWDKNMFLPPAILKQVEDVSEDDVLDYIRSKSGGSEANEDDMDDLQFKNQFGYDWRDKKASKKAKLKKEDKTGDEGSFNKIRKVDALSESWGTLDKERKAKVFESLGINQGSAYTLANLDWYNLSPQLKKDASEAYAKEDDELTIDNDEDLYALHKGLMDKPTKDDEEKEVNEAYRDFYNIEKNHSSPDYKKKALECSRCNEKFYSNKDRDIHFNEFHATEQEYHLPEECPFCKELIKEPETLDWHMEQEHGAHIPSQYTQTGIQGAMTGTDFDKLDDDYYSEAFDSDWACPRCGNKKVTIKKDESGNPIGRSCPKCGLGNESKANERAGVNWDKLECLDCKRKGITFIGNTYDPANKRIKHIQWHKEKEGNDYEPDFGAYHGESKANEVSPQEIANKFKQTWNWDLHNENDLIDWMKKEGYDTANWEAVSKLLSGGTRPDDENSLPLGDPDDPIYESIATETVHYADTWWASLSKDDRAYYADKINVRSEIDWESLTIREQDVISDYFGEKIFSEGETKYDLYEKEASEAKIPSGDLYQDGQKVGTITDYNPKKHEGYVTLDGIGIKEFGAMTSDYEVRVNGERIPNKWDGKHDYNLDLFGEANNRPVVQGDPVSVASRNCYDWEGYEIDCDSGERIGQGYSKSKAYQQFLNESTAEEWSTGISSNDPTAIAQLEAKLIRLEDEKTEIKARPIVPRDWSFSPEDSRGFELTNINANIRSVKERIEDLKSRAHESVYSDLNTEELQRRLERAENKLPTLKTQGGLWALTGEINACRRELNNRGISTGSIIESVATEAEWQCDNCGKQFEDSSGATKHEKETGHHDMGFATTLSGDSKWDKLSKEANGNFLPDGVHLGAPVGYEYSCKQCNGYGMYPVDYDSGRGPRCNRCNGSGIEPGTDKSKYMKGNEAIPDEAFYKTYDTEEEVKAIGAKNPVMDEYSGQWYWNNYVWRVQHGDDITNRDGADEANDYDDDPADHDYDFARNLDDIEKANENRVDDLLDQWGEETDYEDAEAGLDFLLEHGVPKAEAIKALQRQGADTSGFESRATEISGQFTRECPYCEKLINVDKLNAHIKKEHSKANEDDEHPKGWDKRKPDIGGYDPELDVDDPPRRRDKRQPEMGGYDPELDYDG